MISDETQIAYEIALSNELVSLQQVERSLQLVGAFKEDLLLTQGRIKGIRWAREQLKLLT